MSIASEISRLQGAKADLKDAIEGKGVTVPSATKIDGYADLVDSIETGGGGGSDETGSFVASGDQSDVTLSVTALHSHVVIWDSEIQSDEDISTAPYGTKKTLLLYADNNTGFIMIGGLSTAGTGFYSELKGIGRWGGNTAWNDRVEFTGSTIKIINPRLVGQKFPFINGHVINWRAW